MVARNGFRPSTLCSASSCFPSLRGSQESLDHLEKPSHFMDQPQRFSGVSSFKIAGLPFGFLLNLPKRGSKLKKQTRATATHNYFPRAVGALKCENATYHDPNQVQHDRVSYNTVGGLFFISHQLGWMKKHLPRVSMTL